MCGCSVSPKARTRLSESRPPAGKQRSCLTASPGGFPSDPELAALAERKQWYLKRTSCPYSRHFPVRHGKGGKMGTPVAGSFRLSVFINKPKAKGVGTKCSWEEAR